MSVEHFGTFVTGDVERYEAPNVLALNFVLRGALGGGGPRSLRSDSLGKALGGALVRLEIEVPGGPRRPPCTAPDVVVGRGDPRPSAAARSSRAARRATARIVRSSERDRSAGPDRLGRGSRAPGLQPGEVDRPDAPGQAALDLRAGTGDPNRWPCAQQAPHAPEAVLLGRRLDALGAGDEVEAAAELDDHVDHRAVEGVAPEPRDEGAVDLDRLDRELLEVQERGGGGAEVVEGQVDAEAAQARRADGGRTRRPRG